MRLSSIFQKMRLSSIGKIFGSSSIFQNIEEVFHFPKIEVVFHLQKMFRLSSNLGLTPLLYGYLVKFCKFQTISLLVRTAGRPGGRVLEETKLRLTQPSLVELGLGLSLAIPKIVAYGAFDKTVCTAPLGPTFNILFY